MFFSLFRNCSLLIFLVFLANDSFSQDAFTINDLHTVPLDSTEEYSSVTLPGNESHLVVNGTLLVYGNLDMSGNKSQFTMGPDAVVIVYGNFIGSNKVDISISSYLIVMGDFTRTSGSNQASIDIDNGNVYIFGEVDGWQDDFNSCDDYDGAHSYTRNINVFFDKFVKLSILVLSTSPSIITTINIPHFLSLYPTTIFLNVFVDKAGFPDRILKCGFTSIS